MLKIGAALDHANFDSLKKDIEELNDFIDFYHIDFCDGEFVPNISMGYQDFLCVRRNTKKEIHVHLYVTKPELYVDYFIKGKADAIFIYAVENVENIINHIKNNGIKTGISLFGIQDIEKCKDLFSICDYALLNTKDISIKDTNLQFVETSWQCISKLKNYQNKYNFEIILDGSINEKNVKKANKLGADGVVIGSALFKDGTNRYRNNYNAILESID